MGIHLNNYHLPKIITMKKRLCKAVALFLLVLLTTANISAQRRYTKAKPKEPEATSKEMSVSPGTNYTWVTGNWRWSEGRYVWRVGHWAIPPFTGAKWVPGRWVNTRLGWYWVNGRWGRA